MKSFREVCQDISFLNNLSDEESRVLEPLFRREVMPRDTNVFADEGDDLRLYILESGRVKIFKLLPEEKQEVDIAGIGSGECFGEMAFIDDLHRSASAITLSECTIWYIAKSDFNRFRESHKDAAHRIEGGILRMIIQRLRHTSDRFSYQWVYGQFMRGALAQKHEDLETTHEALLAANRFLWAVLNTSPDLIIFIDSDDKITLFNQGAERLSGYSEEEVKGRVVDLLLPSTRFERLHRLLRENPCVTDQEMAMQRKDGSIVPLNVSAALMVDGRKTLGAVITGQDLTEKKRLEEKLMESEKLSLLGQLAGEVVHEIKNPVNNMMLGVSYLRHNVLGCLNQEVDYAIQSLDVQLDRINQIVRNILLFAAPREEERESLALRQLLESAIRFIKPETTGKRILFHLEGFDCNERVLGNSHQFVQLFLNLLTNAVHHTSDGGNITIRLGRDAERYRIEVEDDGQGFPPDVITHVFKPFYTTRKGSGGTGLGLTICRKIVDSAGGAIMAENGAQGARVVILLPALTENGERVERSRIG